MGSYSRPFHQRKFGLFCVMREGKYSEAKGGYSLGSMDEMNVYMVQVPLSCMTTPRWRENLETFNLILLYYIIVYYHKLYCIMLHYIFYYIMSNAIGGSIKDLFMTVQNVEINKEKFT